AFAPPWITTARTSRSASSRWAAASSCPCIAVLIALTGGRSSRMIPIAPSRSTRTRVAASLLSGRCAIRTSPSATAPSRVAGALSVGEETTAARLQMQPHVEGGRQGLLAEGLLDGPACDLGAVPQQQHMTETGRD